MIIDPGDENPAADAVNGVYELHRQMRPGDKILDLGAHKGYFSRIALDKTAPDGDVLAFEPHPGNFEQLLRRCTCERFMAVRAGAWDAFGPALLWEATNNSGGHSFTKVEAGQEPTPIECWLVDIGITIMQHDFEPDFVKIDTELSEFRILKSLMRTPYRPEIAAEIHNQEMWDSCTALLKANGYQMTPDKFTNYYLYAWPK